MRRSQIIARIAALTLGFIMVSLMSFMFIPGLRAVLVMRVSSWRAYAESPLEERGIRMRLPVVRGWFSPMLFFQDNQGLKGEEGQPLSLSIYYTFGAFEDGHSMIYSPGSGYYGSFYGAYLIAGETLPEADPAFIERVAAYDYEGLILRALGHPDPYGTFKVVDRKRQGEVTLFGYPEWTRYDVRIDVPGPFHVKEDWKLHYWQFGTPPVNEMKGIKPFEPVTLTGRIYVKQFETQSLTVMVYLICESREVLEATDAAIRESGRLSLPEESGSP